MAKIDNTYTKYDNVGIREELAEAISNIDPEETPVLSNAGRTKVTNTDYEWQTDTLATPDGNNAFPEGDDITTFTAISPTVRLKNYTQISRKELIISGTTEATNRAGRKSEMAYQAAKRGKEIKRDMETIITSLQVASAGTASTARTTASLLSFIKTNTNIGTGAAEDPVYTNVPTDPRVDGTKRNFTETILKDVAQQIWTSGGDLKMLVVGGGLKQVVSGFAGIADIRYNAQGAKPTTIVGAADVYVSDFGNLTVVPNRFMRDRDALFLDPELYDIAYLRPIRTEALAKTGDAEKRLMIVEWGTKVKNEKGLGGAFDLNATSV